MSMNSEMKPPIPVLRSFDEAKTKEFYVDFLGFRVDWEHRFETGTPLYMQVSRGSCVLHISEHFGDSTPGAGIRIEVAELASYLDGLRAKSYRHARPGEAQLQPWGLREITISDPSGNRLTLYSE
ncbi:VOC family protein [Luteolibacter sp. GHJ8]|uniref:Bleomycin resistance protein n=1 Tax=Luteolibacter rhizosphaerae TaxID=2989719 RepID=A0ABT3FXT3_9BACT|nr:VOC family protein [Luteolibacter rhizosphaerae]MCW1912091.1 VOC family protein [Luteolibacter rhizosphaerae]